VRAAYITAASERNFHTVLGCKLNAIPTVGILHGTASRYYNVSDFMPGFDGEKRLSVDRYGLWSQWWKEYFEKESDVYQPEQLYVSGPMRPFVRGDAQEGQSRGSGPMRVLYIAEQLAVPAEVLPYLSRLLQQQDIALTLKFRPYRDGFEQWLLQHDSRILEMPRVKIVRGDMQEAIRDADVVTGSHSTAVLEALLQMKPMVFFATQKWGDYYDLKTYDTGHAFFAESPEGLVEKIKNAPSISREALRELQERFFGDPCQNGSAWVVDCLEETLTAATRSFRKDA